MKKVGKKFTCSNDWAQMADATPMPAKTTATSTSMARASSGWATPKPVKRAATSQVIPPTSSPRRTAAPTKPARISQ